MPWLFLPLVFSGCGQRSDTWYDRSKTEDERKAEFVEQQMSHGIGENEAKDRFWLNNSIIQTLGREPVEVEGQELREKVSQ